MDYHHRTILVTGGAQVVIADILEAPADPEFAAEYVRCDAGDSQAASGLVTTVLDRFGYRALRPSTSTP